MRIETSESQIVCVADDWKELSKSERDFLSDCYWRGIWVGFDGLGRLIMRVQTAVEMLQKIKTVIYRAIEHGVEYSPEIEQLKEKYEELAKTEREKEEAAKAIAFKKERWKNRKERACVNCPYCVRLGDGWFQCRYSGDELGSRFIETYNPAIQAMELFYEVGEPNEHCKDYINERIVEFGGER